MASTWNSMKRMVGIAIPTSMAVLAIGSGMAMAQETCPAKDIDPSLLPVAGFPGYMDHAKAQACADKYGGGVYGNGCFRFDGSDTLTDVIHAAINDSGACLTYHNIGSGQGETNLRYTAGDSGITGTVKQCLAPMSRNFSSAVETAHTTWGATKDNVMALDAGVFAFKNGGGVDLEDFPSGTCVNECPKVANQTISAIAVAIGGYPQGSNTKSEATTPECADPCRTCILGYFAQVAGKSRIEHIYRRDDKSGTQDTFRERFGVDRWCNGKSEGNLNNPGANLMNEDLDPIRRTCVGADPSHALTKCTYYPTSQPCRFQDADIPANGSLVLRGVTVTNSYSQPLKCTQGVIVALSENDPGIIGDGKTAPDITQSIGMRVSNDPNGYSVGLAGRASGSAPNPPNDVVNVNTITTTFLDNIYLGAYKVSRLLFLQNPFHIENDTCTASNVGEVAGRLTEEKLLWNYSQQQCAGTGVLGMEQIALNSGFLPKWRPIAGCATTSCLGSDVSSTLTCSSIGAGPGTPKQNIGDETSNNACDKAYPCVGNGQLGSGTPLTCGGVGSTCPAIPVLPRNYACNLLNAKCATGTVCIDDGTGTSGLCCPAGTASATPCP